MTPPDILAPVPEDKIEGLPNPIRPKAKAAAATTGFATVLVWLARLIGIDTDDVPVEVWVFAAGAVATVAAIIKSDGLTGAWQLLVNGRKAGRV